MLVQKETSRHVADGGEGERRAVGWGAVSLQPCEHEIALVRRARGGEAAGAGWSQLRETRARRRSDPRRMWPLPRAGCLVIGFSRLLAPLRSQPRRLAPPLSPCATGTAAQAAARRVPRATRGTARMQSDRSFWGSEGIIIRAARRPFEC